MLRGILGTLRKVTGSGTGSNSSNSSNTSQTIQSTIDHTRWKLPVGTPTGISMRNSLTLNKKTVPLVLENNDRTISWYTCGPTVYDSAHLGHARAYVSVDIIHRVLTDYFNLNVNHVMGMTDVDDKIIKMSATKGMSFKELARQKELEFIQDMESLSVRPPLLITRVSEHIPNIINFVKQIRDNGYAYEVETGNLNNNSTTTATNDTTSNFSVLFDTNRFGDRYGKFEKENQGALSDENLAIGSDTKRGNRDFALWKSANPIIDVDGHGKMVVWNSPFGDGRPGWHIECSSMIHSVFGEKLDVHAGGIDLKFPHHENEIAQCEAHFSPQPDSVTGEYKQWVNYFMHIGHLNIKGLKMSKSLKNFITIREYLANQSPASFRWLCLTNRYYETINYNPKSTENYESTMNKFTDWFAMVEQKMLEPININLNRTSYAQAKPIIDLFNLSKNDIHLALTDDFNTPKVIKIMQLLIKETMQSDKQLKAVPRDILFNIYSYVRKMFYIFGLDELFSKSPNVNSSNALGEHIKEETPEQKQEREKQLLERFLDFRYNLRSLIKSDIPLESRNQAILEMCDLERDEMLTNMGIRVQDEDDQYSYEYLTQLEREKLLKKKQTKKSTLDHNASDVSFEFDTIILDDDILPPQQSQQPSQPQQPQQPQQSQTQQSQKPQQPLDKNLKKAKITEIKSSDEVNSSEAQSQPNGQASTQLKNKPKNRPKLNEINENEESKENNNSEKFDINAKNPSEIFTNRKDLYSQFDSEGIPTHYVNGTVITKSQRKQLIKIMNKKMKRQSNNEKNKEKFDVKIQNE